MKEREKERDVKLEEHEKEWWKILELELGEDEYASSRIKNCKEEKKERDGQEKKKMEKEAVRSRDDRLEEEREEKCTRKGEKYKGKREEMKWKNEEEEEDREGERSEEEVKGLENIGWRRVKGSKQWIREDIIWDDIEWEKEEARHTMEGDGKDEKEYEERRKRRIIWQGMVGKSEEERRGLIEEIIKEILKGTGKIRKMEERRVEGGRFVIITEMTGKEERDKILERRTEIWKRWDVSTREDLTYEERELKWRIARKAREERRLGKEVRWDNRKLWVNEEELVWKGVQKGWEKKEDWAKKDK